MIYKSLICVIYESLKCAKKSLKCASPFVNCDDLQKKV